LCGPCDRKGLFQGYYSLGTIDATMARHLIEDLAWVRYKARRYMAAAGVTKPGKLGVELWQQKVAVRLYGDFGLDLPTKDEVIAMYRRSARVSGSEASLKGSANGGGLGEEEFCDLLFELLTMHAAVVSL
jgi:hypothetical protein